MKFSLEEEEAWSKLEQDALNLAPTKATSTAPNIVKSLTELQEMGSKMNHRAKRKAGARKLGYTEYQFMASEGFDFDKSSKMLKDVDMTKMDSVSRASTLNVEEYLRQEHDRMMMEMLDECQREADERFRRANMDYLQKEWQKNKGNFWDAILSKKPKPAQGPAAIGGGLMDWTGGSTFEHALPSGSPSQSNRNANDPSRTQFAEQTAALALAVAHQPAGANPCVHFLEAQRRSSKLPGPSMQREKSEALTELWDCVACVTGEIGRHDQVNKNPAPRGHFANRTTNKARTRELIKGARVYLEKAFHDHIRRLNKANAEVAKRGGAPGTLPDVLAFIRIKLNNSNAWPKEDLEYVVTTEDPKVPIWAVIFFCFRCGDVEAALKAANTGGEQCLNLRNALKDLLDHPSQRPRPESMQALHQEYLSHLKGRCKDPFRVALYNLLGHCDPDTEVFMGHVYPHAESYLWIRLTMLWAEDQPFPATLPRASSADSPWGGSTLSLAQFAEVIVQAGPEHFHDANGMLYPKCLLMTQQFPAFVAYLRSKGFHAAAVHFAIALNHYGLFQPGGDDQGGVFLCKLVGKYAQEISQSVASEVPVYYFFLANVPHNSEAYSKALLDEFRQFLSFDNRKGAFGSIRATDATVQLDGVLSKVYSDREVCELARQTAQTAETCGRFAYAVYLYAFGAEYRAGATTLLKQIGRTIDKPKHNLDKQEVMRALVFFCDSYDRAKERHPQPTIVVPVTDEQHRSIQTAKLLIDFFNFYHLGLSSREERTQSWVKAEQIISQLNALPASNTPTEFAAKRAVVDSLPLLTRHIPLVLVCLFKMWSALVKELAAPPSRAAGTGVHNVDSASASRIQQLKARMEWLFAFNSTLRTGPNRELTQIYYSI